MWRERSQVRDYSAWHENIAGNAVVIVLQLAGPQGPTVLLAAETSCITDNTIQVTAERPQFLQDRLFSSLQIIYFIWKHIHL